MVPGTTSCIHSHINWIVRHCQELFIYIWRLKTATAAGATCKNMFDETSHLLLILRHNDCYLQLLTKYVSQLQWVSRGVQVTPKLLGKLVISLGLEPKDFEVLAVPSPMINYYDISSGQANEKSLYQRGKAHSVFFSVDVHHVFFKERLIFLGLLSYP